MAYQNRTPSIKLKVGIDTFNSLIEFIGRTEQSQEEVVREKATRLKEKLLRYSIPTISDDNEDLIEMRFFPNESGNMIDILLYAIDGVTPSNNYYNVLLEVRNKMKNQNKNNEE